MMCYDGVIINRATLWMYRHRLALVRVGGFCCVVLYHRITPEDGRDGCCCCKHGGQVAGDGLMAEMGEMGVEGKRVKGGAEAEVVIGGGGEGCV